MSDTIIVLTEEALQPFDTDQILNLYRDQDVDYLVLVPADTEHNLLADIFDYVSMGEFNQALEAARQGPTTEPDQARATASEALETTLAQFAADDAEVTGFIVPDDPIPTLVQQVSSSRAREVVVVTRPHTLADTLDRDWASRARHQLGLPVVHFYSGTTRVVD